MAAPLQWATGYNFGVGGDNGDVSGLITGPGARVFSSTQTETNVTFSHRHQLPRDSRRHFVKLGNGTLTPGPVPNGYNNLTAVWKAARLVIPSLRNHHDDEPIAAGQRHTSSGLGTGGIKFSSERAECGRRAPSTSRKEYGEGRGQRSCVRAH